jgi:hypothetical protein
MEKDLEPSDFDDFFNSLYFDEISSLYCQNSECKKEYKFGESEGSEESEETEENKVLKGYSESYCSEKCFHRDMTKDHPCENPGCKKTFLLVQKFQGTHRNRKYCSQVCLDQEVDVKKKEDKLEAQYDRIPYPIKIRLMIENLVDPYKWKELLEMSILTDFEDIDRSRNNLALKVILHFNEEN